MRIAITNVHLDLGSGRRGTDMGPSAMHVAGLVTRLQRLGHTIDSISSLGGQLFENQAPGEDNARFLPAVAQMCATVAARVEAGLAAGAFPLVLGGDHSVAIGTVSGLARHWRKRGKEIGVVWIDAHTDMNTPETTPSGNIHGMPLAVLLGRGPAELVALAGERPALLPENVAIIGARDVDPTEIPLVKELGVRVYTMSELDSRGTNVCVQEAFGLVTTGTAGVHLSFDLDGVDPDEAPGVGTPVPGGLTFRESHLICETASRTGRLLGMEMVELNPVLDERNRTGELAVWLMGSALGQVIL